MAPPVVCIPMKLDAFVLNPSLCTPWPSPSIAPITQPNYTFLRLDSGYLQPDVLPHVDLHAAADRSTNSRLTDLATGDGRDRRVGVYLHWILPRLYRSGISTTAKPPPDKPDDLNKEYDRRAAAGYPSSRPQGVQADPSSISFRGTPNRWLIIRHLHMDKVMPVAARQLVAPFQAFLIESDTVQNIDSLGNEVDLEIDVTPFIYAADNSADLATQAEIFIGKRYDGANVLSWEEKAAKRVRLSVINSSNPLFADYCPHNGNVFSMLDRFEYGIGKKLDSAVASYQVIGWHSEDQPSSNTLPDDPFIISPADKVSTHQTRLDGCKLAFADKVKDQKEVIDWLQSNESTRVLVHGSMYGVEYSATAPPTNSGAEQLVQLVKNSSAVAVGTTSLDTALAFVGANIDKSSSDEKSRYKELTELQPLLLKQEESTDGQLEANDMLSAHNFAPAKDSGTHWHISGQDPSGQGTQPAEDQLQKLRDLNAYQEALDLASRDLRQERWNLWALWWKYNSPVTNEEKAKYEDQAPKKSADIQTLETKVAAYQAEVAKRQLDVQNCQSGARDPFFSLKDPTLLVAGVKSPWPSDYLEDLVVRLDTQLVMRDAIPADAPAEWKQFGPYINSIHSSKIIQNTSLKDAMKGLMLEFFELRPDNQPNQSNPSNPGGGSGKSSEKAPVKPTVPPVVKATGKPLDKTTAKPADMSPSTPSDGSTVKPSNNPADQPSAVFPLYHDDRVRGPRDSWQSRQPWFPLFLEWEALYYHIDWAKWSFEHVTDAKTGVDRVKYGITDLGDISVYNADKAPDVRKVSGRVLILPQPSFSFKNVVQQLIASTPQDVLEKALGYDDTAVMHPVAKAAAKAKVDAELMTLADSMGELQFLSAPLDGFTNHLVTQLQGSHLKPGFRLPGQQLTALPSAITASGLFKELDIERMGAETGTTPYANQVSFGNVAHCPFKPVAHGQFCFTQLNIIDKFGQAVSALDPAIGQNTELNPVISEYYQPQLKLGKPMVVQNDDPVNTCRFMQIPPNINQDARMNAVFLTRDNPTVAQPLPPWRPALEWESPIWGWIVVNYVEAGIQLFLPEGSFYAEMRAGGIGGTTETKWKPFKPAAAPNGTSQLDALLAEFDKRPDYLRGFITSITDALDSVPPAPSAYADYLPAIVGKPLALVNTGWSLELACDPLKNESSQNTADPDIPLTGYNNLKVKLGDKDRIYDGVVGLWDGTPNTFDVTKNVAIGPAFGKELVQDPLWTYFPGGAGTSDISQPKAANDPKTTLPPHYLDLTPYKLSTLSLLDKTPEQIQAMHYSQFKVVGAMIDPFTAMHGYSGVQPITTLKLPPWSVELALKKMTAFFTMGPLLITTPNPQSRYLTSLKINQTKALPATSTNGSGSGNDLAPVGMGVPIPAIQSADWQWLQPYFVDDSKGNDGKGTGNKQTEWNGIGIEPLDNSAKLQPGPYTAIEGYLQLKKPIGSNM